MKTDAKEELEGSFSSSLTGPPPFIGLGSEFALSCRKLSSNDDELPFESKVLRTESSVTPWGAVSTLDQVGISSKRS
jgi:hypothetical protein